MKHFILTIILCISIFGFSQEKVDKDRTISVYGIADIASKKIKYKTDITLSLDNTYYSGTPCRTIEELKAKYFTELLKQGIDTTKFENNKLGYAGLGYRKEGALLTFITDNKDEILKVVSLKMRQINTSYVQMKTEVGSVEIEKTTKIAMLDAKKNAEIVARAAGEKIDVLQSIGSYDLGTVSYWQTINSNPTKLRLTVVYKLKE